MGPAYFIQSLQFPTDSIPDSALSCERTEMLRKVQLILIIALLLAGLATQTRAAIMIENLPTPTMQTLIGLGSGGVIVGDMKFYDFSYLSIGAGAPSASNIAVQSTGIDGIRLLSGWSASDGDFVSGLIAFKVTPVDLSTLIAGLNLFSDGTAIVPGNGTFASVAETARDAGGNVLGTVLSTFNDGPGGLADRNNDYSDFTPVSTISIIQSLQLKSKPFAQGGGLATLSVIDINVVPIPEPTAGLTMLGIAGVAVLRRRAHNN